MLIIDTHAHVFPSLADKLIPQAFRQAVDDWIQNAQMPAGFESMRGSWMRWIDTLQKKPLDIETIAWLQGRLHPQIFKMVEGLLTQVLGPKQVLAGTEAALRESMEAHDIDKTIIIASRTYAPNDFILALGKANPSLLPVVNLPELSEKATDEDWYDAAVKLSKAGAVGFKIHAHMDNISESHPGARAFFEVAAKDKKFVILHTGCFHIPLYKKPDAHPLTEFEGLIKKHSDVRLCLAHMNREHPEAVWSMMHKYEQLYTDTSWQPAQNIRQALANLGSDRLLFGSDWPLLNNDLQGDALSLLRAACNDAEFEKIADTNAMTFIGL